MALKLKIRRIELGKKQKDIAKEIGVSSQYLSNLENGFTKNPNLEIIKKLSKALNSTVEELFFD
ncbi:MAG: helix-turn-helix transcriptional regulator [Clostridium butyricum]